MNTYNTFCEAPGCVEAIVYQAESFAAAVNVLRSRNWSAVRRDAHGYESFCPAHKDGRTETMQRCSECGKWCGRTLNSCPTCNAVMWDAHEDAVKGFATPA